MTKLYRYDDNGNWNKFATLVNPTNDEIVLVISAEFSVEEMDIHFNRENDTELFCFVDPYDSDVNGYTTICVYSNKEVAEQIYENSCGDI